MNKFLVLIILVTSLAYAQKKDDPVVATVNGKNIKKSTLLAYHQQNLNFIQGNKEVTLKGSLNDLIDRIIGIESAKKSKIHERPEVVKKMNDIVYHAFISQELTPKLQKIVVKEKDIEKYFSKFPEYKTSQILLRLRTLPTDEEVAQALDTAAKIYKEASIGSDKEKAKKFAELARQYSQTTTSITGGDMGYQPRSRLSKEYFDAINGKRIGHITKPFRSQYGIHVVMITGKKTYKQIDKKLYRKIVYDQKRDAILQGYFAEKRKQAKIQINNKAMTL